MSDLVLCSTGTSSDYEKRAMYLAKKHKKKTIAYIDHWVQYRERFLINNKIIRPDEIWVSDTYALLLAKKKNLKSQNWLRQYKTKQYPWWRIDKPENVKVIKDGGWHFSFLYDVDGIIKKISSYQHTEFDVDDIKNKNNIIQKIERGEDIFNRNYNFKKINIDDRYPEYLIKNKKKYLNWIKS